MTSTSEQASEPVERGGSLRTPARWAVFVAAIVLQLVVVYTPSSGPGGGVPYLDKAVHAAIFGLVAWSGLRLRLPAAALLGVLGAHAVISEVLQGTLLPRRSGDVLDAVADVVGIALGALVAGHHFDRVERARRQRKGTPPDAGRAEQ
ncbi:VanZ family protein [Motilibacter aurantiacus]|uniref:VanZ family protein n=1 Tax=Motilibacter aurantiacus TaxID=2714955 RepID=UPI0018C8B957|nr:VanZ family protein [Motilibacter aurantiacus]NHC45271.1 VanZ family protein [Motilibacter aurantiacus]